MPFATCQKRPIFAAVALLFSGWIAAPTADHALASVPKRDRNAAANATTNAPKNQAARNTARNSVDSDSGHGFGLEHLFPEPAHIRMQTRFWEKVFGKYPSTSILIHDAYYPEVIVDVIDLDAIARRDGQRAIDSREKRRAITERYVRRYTVAMKRLQEEGDKAARLGAMEERVLTVYKRNQNAYAALMRGAAELRTQSGLADEFLRAAERARPMLPQMERMFREENVPPVLTRVAFVESMFNINARSKVGASGMWQFMPGTAKAFMQVNHFVDERNAPFKATRAAAQYFALNFRALNSWPLAITAYNHGRNSMERAQRELGTSNIETIVKRYRAASFGFASRNFYAEFLAARNTYATVLSEGLIGNGKRAPDVATIRLGRSMSVAEFMKRTRIDQRTLQRLNPCLLPTAFARYRNRPLPASYELSVPRAQLASVRRAIDRGRVTTAAAERRAS